jgi:hypothetical protein
MTSFGVGWQLDYDNNSRRYDELFLIFGGIKNHR